MSIHWQAVFDPRLALEALPAILEGLPYTLALSLLGFLLGTFLGFFVALLRMSNFGPFRWLAMWHTSLMSNLTPVPVPFDQNSAEAERNYRSHTYGVVDDCYRCIDCEIGEWNGWKELCWMEGR